LVVIDSVQTGRVPPGHLHEVDEAHINTLPGMSPHFLGVGEILTLGRLMGLPVPERVCLFAVEAEDSHTLGTDLSDSVALALPGVVDRVAARITEWSNGSATN
jgi:hydrogenase maturation protease